MSLKYLTLFTASLLTTIGCQTTTQNLTKSGLSADNFKAIIDGKNVVLIILMYICCISSGYATTISHITPTLLKVEHMISPTVVDTPQPRFSWINTPADNKLKGVAQSAYRIVVSSSKDNLDSGLYDIWDTDKIPSAQSYLISYAGKELEDGQDYFWKVMVWDENGTHSAWSDSSHFGMGLLSNSNWHAKWIGATWQSNLGTGSADSPAPLFRKEFSLEKQPAKAKVLISAMGYFELHLNGKKVGNDVLVPNFTNYTKRPNLENYHISIDNNFSAYRIMYLAYDISPLLQSGNNAIGVVVGNGFADTGYPGACSFGTPRFICQVELEYADGSTQTIISDDTWHTAQSPILVNGPFAGELYDANKELCGWDNIGYDASQWANAELKEAPVGELCAHMAPTDKICELYSPISLIKLDDKVWEVSFPTEISGWIHLKDVKVEKNDTINIIYQSESPQGIHKYIAGSFEPMDYAPRFTWFVFSKAKIYGVESLTIGNIVAEAVNTDVKKITRFSTSNPMLDSIVSIWQRSQLDNMHGGIASDCPHRERAPYTGDGQVAMAMVMANFDTAAFYRKWIRDMRDAQNPSSGYVPNGAPWQPGCGGGAAWGAAMNIMPWEHYLHYGDIRILEENYDAMKAQVNYMRTWLTDDGTMLAKLQNVNSPDGEANYWLNLGDWVAPYDLPDQELVHTFYLWRCTDYTARAAMALGYDEDADLYRQQAEKVSQAFHAKFYKADHCTYGDFGANIFALEMGVPAERKADVIESLRKEIEVTHNGHLNTGVFATRYFFEQLCNAGLTDLAYTVITKRDFPSFGFWLEQGATTTWEQWNGDNSHNHPMFGGGLTWLYNTLAGLKINESSPGFKDFLVRPQLPNGIDRVELSTLTPYGVIKILINRTKKELSLEVSVPVGSRAQVHIPVSDNSQKVYLDGNNKMHIIKKENNYKVVQLGQGTYKFTVY